jgi:hypothetical protein
LIEGRWNIFKPILGLTCPPYYLDYLAQQRQGSRYYQPTKQQDNLVDTGSIKVEINVLEWATAEITVASMSRFCPISVAPWWGYPSLGRQGLELVSRLKASQEAIHCIIKCSLPSDGIENTE